MDYAGEFYYKELHVLKSILAFIYSSKDNFICSISFQIFLSELLGVPAAIENGKPGESTSFYDADMGFTYGSASYVSCIAQGQIIISRTVNLSH